MIEFTEDQLKKTAQRLIDLDPDPIPRYRLLRDVFRLNPGSTKLAEARSGIEQSKWVRLLASSRHDDGTWGRFHSQDTKIKQPFPTTQNAVRAAIECGLDKDSEILRRLMPTLTDYVEGKYIWSDTPEKHDNPDAWQIWVRHFSAGTLATIDALHPLIDKFWKIRVESLEEAFEYGSFDRDREIIALNRLLQCRMKKPVPFHVQPALAVLGATEHTLPEWLERAIFEFLFSSTVGIYYVYSGDLGTTLPITHRRFWDWTRALDLMSPFPLWTEYAEPALNCIWEQRNENGLWDTTAKIGRRPYTSFPLSESWRRRENKSIDFTTEMLSLLSKAFTSP